MHKHQLCSIADGLEPTQPSSPPALQPSSHPAIQPSNRPFPPTLRPQPFFQWLAVLDDLLGQGGLLHVTYHASLRESTEKGSGLGLRVWRCATIMSQFSHLVVWHIVCPMSRLVEMNLCEKQSLVNIARFAVRGFGDKDHGGPAVEASRFLFFQSREMGRE